MPEPADDDLQPQLPAAQPRVPRRVHQVLLADAAHGIGQVTGCLAAAGGDLAGGDRGVAVIHLGRPVIYLGEIRWRVAEPDRPQPLHLLLAELGVVREHRQRSPALRAARLADGSRRNQHPLLGRGQAEQANDRAGKPWPGGHCAFPAATAGRERRVPGLWATNFRTPSTVTVMLPNPIVCSRASADAGSTGL